MADQDDVVKCPFCQGQGELRRAEMIRRLSSTNFPKILGIYLAQLIHPGARGGEPVGEGAKDRDFYKEVHSWNPKLPIWRRSSKE
jgi:hypothetical protein